MKTPEELLELASGYGVKITIEPEVHNLITTTKDFLNYVRKWGDNLICNFDVGHAFLTDEDMFESINFLEIK